MGKNVVVFAFRPITPITPKLCKRKRLFLYCKNFFPRYPGMPYESWRPAGSENVVVFVAIIFKTRVTAAQSQRSLSSKLCGVKKNEYGYNFSFQVLPFNQPQNIPIWSTLIEYGSKKFKIERVFIFFDATTLQKKSWDLTWFWAAINPI